MEIKNKKGFTFKQEMSTDWGAVPIKRNNKLEIV